MDLERIKKEETKLIAYVPITLDEIDEFVSLMGEVGWGVEVITTKEFFDQQKFKLNSPRA